MPDTRPGLVFDDQGICKACVNFEKQKKTDWDKRWKLFDLEYQSISILDIEKIGYDSKIKRQGIKKLVDKMLSKS